MDKKELLKKYIEQLTDEWVRLQPYFKIISDEADIYNLLYEKDKLICFALGINEEEYFLVTDFAHWKATGDSFNAVYDMNDKLIETADELINLLLGQNRLRN